MKKREEGGKWKKQRKKDSMSYDKEWSGEKHY